MKRAAPCGERTITQPQGVGGGGIGAEQVGAGDLGPAINAWQTRAPDGRGTISAGDGAAPAGNSEDGFNDLEIAGAATQDTADGVLDLALAGLAPRSGR